MLDQTGTSIQEQDKACCNVPQKMHSIRVVFLKADKQRLVVLKFTGLGFWIRRTSESKREVVTGLL
jgi:hypothetical protein